VHIIAATRPDVYRCDDPRVNSGTLQLLLVCVVLVAVLLPIRRALMRRGSGALAQRQFREQHGVALAASLGGQLDPMPTSPWIEFHLGGRPARLVAAPLFTGGLQAGVELLEWDLPVQITFTNGDRTEIHPRAGVTEDQVLPFVHRLAELRVDSVSSPRFMWEGPHIMRVQFSDVADLPAQLARIAPVLAELETLGVRGSDDHAI